MGQKQKKIRQKVIGIGRETREENIEKWDQTDSPEIPDKGKTSESLASLRRLQDEKHEKFCHSQLVKT